MNNPTSPILQYAGFWWRFLAWLIDMLLLGALYAVLFGGPVPGLITFIIGWLYYAFCESSAWQATLGKRACGLIVTTEGYETVTFARASGRYVARILSVLTCGIGFIMAAFTQRKQTLHDIIADTLVLKL
ncbi:MAG: RDD family protein [Bdellovibrionales bacterium]